MYQNTDYPSQIPKAPYPCPSFLACGALFIVLLLG
jgi:hypothetical protein